PSGSGITINNTGSISGGAGGAGGAGVNTGGDGSTGGAAIIGANLIVINSGTVTRGTGGAGGAGTSTGQNGAVGNAITFANGTFGPTDNGSVLEIRQGSNIIGNVVSQNGNATLRLGGATNGSFDVSSIGAAAQYQGFAGFV